MNISYSSVKLNLKKTSIRSRYPLLRHRLPMRSVREKKHINLLHDKKQKLGHIFNVELGQSSKAFRNLRVQW